MSTKPNQCLFDNAAYQQFVVPKPIIYYLMINTSSVLLQKLYKTCKYFYAKLRIAVVDQDFHLHDSWPYPYIKPQDVYSAKNKFWLTDVVALFGSTNIQKFCGKIAKFNPKILFIRLNGKFAYNEFKLLTEKGCIKKLELQVHVSYSDDTKVPVEDIMELLPNIESILVLYSTVTSKTIKTLTQMEHPKKYKAFRLFDIQQILNADEVIEFIQKKMEWNEIIILHYHDDNIAEAFGAIIGPKIFPHLSEKALTYFLKYYGISRQVLNIFIMSTSPYHCLFDNAAHQEFVLPEPTIHYLMTNTNSQLLQKLYKTCKYFYAKLQIAVVDNHFYLNDSSPNPHVKSEALNAAKNKFWFTDFVGIFGDINFQNFCNKIAKFYPRNLYIGFNGKFAYNEFKLLTEKGCIKKLELQIHMYYFDDTKVPVEDIIELLPSIETILILHCTVTSKTIKKLTQMENPKKFYGLRLYNIQQMFDADEVIELIKKKIERDQIIILHYQDDEAGEAFGDVIGPKVLPHLSEKALSCFLKFYGIRYP